MEKKIVLRPQDTKNRAPRIIDMERELLQAICEQKALRDRRFKDCPFVLFSEKGKLLNDFRFAWKAVLERAGIEGKTLHDFRRTAVRNMVRTGVPERVAMMVSGHKTRSVFDRYNIVNEDDLKLAAKRVYEYFCHNLVTISDFKDNDAPKEEKAPILYH